MGPVAHGRPNQQDLPLYLPTHAESVEIFRIHPGLKKRDPDAFTLDAVARIPDAGGGGFAQPMGHVAALRAGGGSGMMRMSGASIASYHGGSSSMRAASGGYYCSPCGMRMVECTASSRKAGGNQDTSGMQQHIVEVAPGAITRRYPSP